MRLFAVAADQFVAVQFQQRMTAWLPEAVAELVAEAVEEAEQSVVLEPGVVLL